MINRFLDWLGYVLVIYGPLNVTCNADHWLGAWCLPHAGNWAYRDEPADSRHDRNEAKILLDRNPRIRDLMDRWDDWTLTNAEWLYLPGLVSHESDAGVNWLRVFRAARHDRR